MNNVLDKAKIMELLKLLRSLCHKHNGVDVTAACDEAIATLEQAGEADPVYVVLQTSEASPDELFIDVENAAGYSVRTPCRTVNGERRIGPLYLTPPAQAAKSSRDDIIQVPLSTQGQSEGVTADAILSLMCDPPAQAVGVPDAKLIQAIARRGFSLEDCPYTPIISEWESYPIIKAIREAERETGLEYKHTPTPAAQSALPVQEPTPEMIVAGDEALNKMLDVKRSGEWGDQLTVTAIYKAMQRAAPAPAEKSIPDNWKLVPVEPTRAMRYAVEDTELPEFCTSSRQSRHHNLGVQVYRAMLDAAPAAPVTGEGK